MAAIAPATREGLQPGVRAAASVAASPRRRRDSRTKHRAWQLFMCSGFDARSLAELLGFVCQLAVGDSDFGRFTQRSFRTAPASRPARLGRACIGQLAGRRERGLAAFFL